jgi:hypothetical protein
MNDRRRIMGVGYATTRSLLRDAGPTGASVDDIAQDDNFDGYADPHNAVRRAIRILMDEGLVEEMPTSPREWNMYRWVESR